MRFFLSQIILALGVGVIVALVRYYTTLFAWRYLKTRLRAFRKAGRHERAL